MDTSNPVLTGERVTLGDFQNSNIMLKRQDYDELQRLVESGKRIHPQRMGSEEVEVKPNVLKRLESSGMLPGEKGKLEIPVRKVKDNVLVGKYHPKGINQAGAHVSVERLFPQRKRLRQVVEALLTFNPLAAPLIESVTYTGGTKTGFVNRLQKWAHRKPVRVKPLLAEWGFNGYDILDECMPVKTDELVDWNQGLKILLDGVTVTKTSSAGPPFFQPKWRCLDEIYTAVNEIADAISSDTVDEFFAQNPEFILSECKNKMDRYEIASVKEKTRPYWGFSAPISFLISILAQDFCANLDLFHDIGSNAYGFSWAHGGGSKMWSWMIATEEGEMKFCVYGDDTKLVWRKDGILYECNPDFEQMDGSVDRDTIELTVTWILKKYKETWGNSNFFEYVGALWIYLASGSEFLVDGPEIYSNETGLLTGVVGTTLFDCAKSHFAYKIFVHTRQDPMDEMKSVEFFKKFGLVVKKGTWNPVAVEEVMEAGRLCSTEKFLGSKLMVIKGEVVDEPIPYVDEDDLLKLVGNLRQQVYIKNTMLNRRIFDSARGYMITSAFHHPRIWDAMCLLIERTPNDVIVQRVQAGKGKGEGPELETFVGVDFEWPTSDGYPTADFCRNVYLHPRNKIQKEELWIYAFPDLKSHLSAFRRRKKYVEPFTLKNNKNDWNFENALEEADVENRMDDKLLPEISADDMAVLTRAKFKPPKNFVKFKELTEVDKEKKENRLDTILEVMEEVHHRALTLLLPYGGYWITHQMLKRMWHYTANGFWTKDALKQAQQVTSVWGYEEARALGETREGVSEPASSVSARPDIAREEVVLDENLPGVLSGMREDGISIPPRTMTAVSFVSAYFVNAGNTITEVSEVLSQAPVPRIKVLLSIRGTDKKIGYAVAASKKEAKKALMEQVMEMVQE